MTTDDFVIGFVGRVVRSKGVEEIYHAFKNLRGSYANLKLLVVGPVEKTSDAVDDDILSEMNADTNVIMAGQRKDVEYCYHVMNLFTLPSHNFREGFGNVAMEASACGLPIVVTRGAGCQDAVIDGETGKLINPMSSDELELAFQYYLDNRDMAHVHGANGVRYANEFFRNDVIWNAQLDLYKSLLK